MDTYKVFGDRCDNIQEKLDNLEKDIGKPSVEATAKVIDVEDKAKESLETEKLCYHIPHDKSFLGGYCIGYRKAMHDARNRGLSKEDAFEKIVNIIHNTII